MKKLLLLFFALSTISFASAQMGQPFDISICDGGEVYFADQTGTVLGNSNPADFTVTYHLTQLEANNGMNALPDPFVFTSSQTVFVRVTENANPTNFQILTFMVSVFPSPLAPSTTYNVCDSDGTPDGITMINLEFAIQQVIGGQSNVSVEFFETQTDAFAQANPLPWYYTNTANGQVIYYSITDWFSGCMSVGTLTIVVGSDCSTICPPPSQIVATNISNDSLVLGWTETGTSTQWEVIALPTGNASPSPGDTGIYTNSNPFVFTGLTCGNTYDFYVRSLCLNGGGTGWTAWSESITVNMTCIPVAGQAANLEMCSDTNQACFDLTQNDINALGTLNPTEHTIVYYASESDAVNGINPIINPAAYCVTQPGLDSLLASVRVDSTLNNDFYVSSFALTVRQVTTSNFTPIPMTQCDEDGNGIVVFDLTSVAAQINTANPLSYYTNSLDATSVSGNNAMTTPQSFQMSTTMGMQSTVIFVRENITDGCDIIYSLQLFASSNCNVANVCASANSLCASLGEPFSNTVNIGTAEPGNDYGCLFTVPNPTWFHLPISQTGSLSFQISQTSNAGMGIDVDFVAYGPFSDPVTPCQGMLNAMNITSCSYSASNVENFTIQNAQPGQFYLLLVTNFSNQPGQITITQLNEGQPGSGDIDCTGLRMTAFRDANGNGVKDSGEFNFALGQFHYERNDDGIVHNVSSPTGKASIFDLNPANSYDLSYTINPEYVANYAVSPSSYSNVSVIAGGGMIDYYFPITVTQAYDDVSVVIIPNQSPSPGFTYTNTVRYTNLGSQAASGTVTFTKPTAVTITSISQAGTTSTATGFTYDYSGLQPFESRDIVVSMQVPFIPSVNLGDVLTAMAEVSTTGGDIAPENNLAVMTQTIVGSWDPNDKAESRGQYVLFSDFGPDDYLYYTIRFENEGTAPALMVKINDVLESQLDETSVRMVTASHDYVLDRTGNVLNWTFDNIQLPYASANPEGAKGYVQFKVKPKPGYAIGDVIQNTASIYFDYNPAVVTNTFETHFVQSMGNPGVSASEFNLYPNPAGDQVTVSLSANSGTISGIVIYDVLGKKVLEKSSGSNVETVNVSGLSSGMYFLEVINSTQSKTTKKLVIK